jgi:aspartate/methionine/tyrosine aminotransferase
LRGGAAIRGQIQSRIAHNLARARTLADAHPACELLRVEGGWSAVIRVPATRNEEDLVLELLRRERILVHPGFFFDFRHEAFIVVSLLPRPDMFEDALGRVLRHSVT